MASTGANLISEKMAEYLGQPLTEEQLLKCEELNLNYFTNAVLGYIKGLIRKKAPKMFELVYDAILGGVLRGALRRHDIIYLRGAMLDTYNKLSAFVGDGMGEGELSDIIALAENCTARELDAAIQAARISGGQHVAYVRAIIDKNRRAASRSRAISNKKKFIPSEYIATGIGGVPRVDLIRDLWKERIRNAEEMIEINNTELNLRRRKRGL
jgi:hypothetical protein